MYLDEGLDHIPSEYLPSVLYHIIKEKQPANAIFI